MQPSIIIIGGGIAGLTTSIALKKKGLDSRIYERSAQINPGGAGLSLWANATAILAELGLLEQLLPRSNKLEVLQARTFQGKSLNSIHLGKLEKKFPSPSIIALRSELQKVLSEAVPSNEILYDKQCTDISQEPDKVTVSFTDGTTERADLVVFCDGIHSIARQKIFGYPPLRYAGRTSWRGVAEFSRPFFDRKHDQEIFGIGKRIGIFPLTETTAYWFAAVNMTEKEAFQQHASKACILSHFPNWTEPVKSLVENTPDEKLILTNILYSPVVKTLVNGRCVLLGDAAHPMTPDLGQGACQAIEDACIFAECVGAAGSMPAGLEAYQGKGLPRVRKIVRDSYNMGRLRQMGHPAGFWLRNMLFRMAPEQIMLQLLAKNIRHERSLK